MLMRRLAFLHAVGLTGGSTDCTHVAAFATTLSEEQLDLLASIGARQFPEQAEKIHMLRGQVDAMEDVPFVQEFEFTGGLPALLGGIAGAVLGLGIGAMFASSMDESS